MGAHTTRRLWIGAVRMAGPVLIILPSICVASRPVITICCSSSAKLAVNTWTSTFRTRKAWACVSTMNPRDWDVCCCTSWHLPRLRVKPSATCRH